MSVESAPPPPAMSLPLPTRTHTSSSSSSPPATLAQALNASQDIDIVRASSVLSRTSSRHSQHSHHSFSLSQSGSDSVLSGTLAENAQDPAPAQADQQARTPSRSPPSSLKQENNVSTDNVNDDDKNVVTRKSKSTSPLAHVIAIADPPPDPHAIAIDPFGFGSGHAEPMVIDPSLMGHGADTAPDGVADGEGEDVDVDVPETAKMPLTTPKPLSYPDPVAGGDLGTAVAAAVANPSAVGTTNLSSGVAGPTEGSRDWLGMSTYNSGSDGKDCTNGAYNDQTLGKPTPWSLQTTFSAALPGSEPGSKVPSAITQSDSPSSYAPWGSTASSLYDESTGYDSYASSVAGGGGPRARGKRDLGSMDFTGSESGSGWEGGASAASGASTRAGTEAGDAVADRAEEEGKEAREGVPPPRTKKSHARKQPEGHIKRARNAFILFRKHITDSNLIPASVEVKHQNISVVAAKMWKEAPQEVRAKFQEQARIEKEEHQRKYPGYRYQPVFRRTDIIRRRVRKDQAEDDKVEAVAEALIKGKAGESLEKEIKEQLVSRSETESEVESTSTRSSRRRRRETGQLSKGAIRAQRAQARAKQMRQNLLGSNLLNVSLYNAAQHRLASSNQAHAHGQPYASHPHALAQAHAHAYSHGGYAHPGMQHAMAVGYDFDPHHMGGVPYQQAGAEMYAPAPGAGPGAAMRMGDMQHGYEGGEMYRLPPIEGMVGMNAAAGAYDGWPAQPQGQGSAEYWDATAGVFRSGLDDYAGLAEASMPGVGATAGVSLGGGDYYAGGPYEMGEALPNVNIGVNMDMGEYRLPPLLEASREGSQADYPMGAASNASAGAGTGTGTSDAAMATAIAATGEETDPARVDRGEDPRLREWARDGQQTPSGHVMFNERLFDGALGTSGLQDRRDGEEGLGALFEGQFESEVPPW